MEGLGIVLENTTPISCFKINQTTHHFYLLPTGLTAMLPFEKCANNTRSKIECSSYSTQLMPICASTIPCNRARD